MIAIYTRVSTQEQAREGYSIDEQAARLNSYCDAMNWRDVKLYTDPGYSGGSTDRPALQQLIRDVEAGMVSRVVVYKLDRLSRSQLDTLYLIERVFLAHGCEFVSISESFDTGTPFGRAMIGILAVFAQLEREQIKERMTMGREARAKEGKYHGGSSAPTGYDYTDGELVVYPPEAMQVREVFRLYASGLSLRQIAQKFLAAGISHRHGIWSECTIRKVLQNPAYIGRIVFSGQTYEGHHEPIIGRAMFDAVQDRLSVRSEQARKKQAVSGRNHLLSGLIWCARCGARYGVHKTNYSIYYACYSAMKRNASMIRDPNCKNTYWRETELDALILDQIAKLSTDPSELKKTSSQPPTDERIAMLESTLADVRRQKDRLLDLYVTKAAFSAAELQNRVDPLAEREKRLLGEIEALTASRGMDTKKAAQIVATFADVIARDVYAEKRSLVESLIDRIEVDGRSITIRWKF